MVVVGAAVFPLQGPQYYHHGGAGNGHGHGGGSPGVSKIQLNKPRWNQQDAPANPEPDMSSTEVIYIYRYNIITISYKSQLQ